MPAGKYFRGLTTFDLLGNLLPGTVVLIAFLAVFPDPPVPSAPGEYLLAGVFAFSVGHFVQAHASSADGDERSFDWTWEKARQLARPPEEDSNGGQADTRADDGNRQGLAKIAEIVSRLVQRVPNVSFDGDDGDAETNNGVENPTGAWAKLTYPLFGPILWRCYQSRGRVLLDEMLANRLWLELQDTYKFEYGTDDYSFLYQLMASEIDDVNTPSRALRFQALRNFHRGMWIATWWTLLMLFVPDALGHFIQEGEIFFGVAYHAPGLLNYWTPTWHIYAALLAAIYGFWYMAQSFTEEFIEYLFIDYAVTVKDRLGEPVDSRPAEQSASGKTKESEREDGTEEEID